MPKKGNDQTPKSKTEKKCYTIKLYLHKPKKIFNALSEIFLEKALSADDMIKMSSLAYF